jgi:hypothetical protein
VKRELASILEQNLARLKIYTDENESIRVSQIG